MENKTEQEDFAKKVFQIAAHLMLHENKSTYATKKILIEKGLQEEVAKNVVNTIEKQIKEAKNKRANKDIIYGLLWCGGGIAATAMVKGNVLFWGAILFGGIQFFKGVSNLNN